MNKHLTLGLTTKQLIDLPLPMQTQEVLDTVDRRMKIISHPLIEMLRSDQSSLARLWDVTYPSLS